ncbi:MAG TPA: extracellular solute-binding protein, partial [Pirellulales bacterium]
DLGWSDVYEGVRQGDCRFGANVYGLPLGVQTLVVYARQDWLDELKLAPPKTWAEYQQVAEAFAKRPASENQPPMAATLEPLGQGWAGLTLLTRAAAYAKDRGHYSTLFDVEDMHAEIASPPFVRALDELKAAAPRPETFDVLNASPDDVRRAFLDGRCGLALCRPNLREKPSGEAPQGEAGSAPAEAPLVAPDALSIHPVPGAADVYNRSRKAWQPRKADDGARVPLSGVAGRLAAVSAGSKHPEAAFELAAALIGGRWGGAIRRSSDAAGPCRKSDQADAQTWVADPAERRAATQYVDAVGATLTSVDHLDALRIPGRERYLAALDAAVQKAVRGELDSAAALAEAAQEWERITYELGRDKQGAAYRKSVGYE